MKGKVKVKGREICLRAAQTTVGGRQGDALNHEIHQIHEKKILGR